MWEITLRMENRVFVLVSVRLCLPCPTYRSRVFPFLVSPFLCSVPVVGWELIEVVMWQERQGFSLQQGAPTSLYCREGKGWIWSCSARINQWLLSSQSVEVS